MLFLTHDHDRAFDLFGRRPKLEIPDRLSADAVRRVMGTMDQMAEASGFPHRTTDNGQLGYFVARANALIGRKHRSGFTGFARFKKTGDEPSKIITVTHMPDADQIDQFAVRVLDTLALLASRVPLDQLIHGKQKDELFGTIFGRFNRNKVLRAIPDNTDKRARVGRRFGLQGLARLWGPG